MSVYAVNSKEPIAAWIPSLDTAGNGTTTLTDFIGSKTGTLTNFALTGSTSNWVADTGAGGVRALDHDGSNDIVALASAVDLLSGNFGVSGWFKQVVLSGGDVLIGAASPFYLIVVDATTIYMYLSGGFSSLSHGGAITTGVWNHYCISRSGTTITWYINGTSLGTRTNSGLMTFSSLGGYSTGTGTFQGRLDDIRVFDQSLDSSDVSYLYYAGAGRGRVAVSGESRRRRQSVSGGVL